MPFLGVVKFRLVKCRFFFDEIVATDCCVDSGFGIQLLPELKSVADSQLMLGEVRSFRASRNPAVCSDSQG